MKGGSDAPFDMSVTIQQLLSLNAKLTLPPYDHSTVDNIISRYGSNPKGVNSMARAKYIFALEGSPTPARDACPGSSSVFTLCGDGSNCFEATDAGWDTVYHFDIGPIVVGHMRCMGFESMYTNGPSTTFK